MPGTHPDAEENHPKKCASPSGDVVDQSRLPIATPVEGDLGIRKGPDHDFEVRHLPSSRVLSTHRDLLDAVVACHSLANAYNITVWQEVDSDGHSLPEARALYTRRTDTA